MANGESIPNLGERRLDVMTEGSNWAKRMHFQVADVHKPLLSISRVADMGYGCYFGKDGGYLEDLQSGERVPIRRVGNLYVLRMWVKQAAKAGSQGFQRQGSSGRRQHPELTIHP